MKKAKKIAYWIFTIWLALGLVSTGVVQTLHVDEEIQFILDLGYPEYLLTLLGISKILAAIAVLLPGIPRLKEWAYAGVSFTMLGALYSHVASGHAEGMFPPLLLLALTAISWYTRPASRTVAAIQAEHGR